MGLLAPGDVVGDRLVVQQPLGQGAYAEVYRVWHEVLGRQAMKVFKHLASDAETRKLLGEAQLLSRLGHPNIVRVFDAGMIRTAEGVRGYFTMEYLPGGSLHRLLGEYTNGVVPLDVAVDVIEQMTAGMVAAHQQEPPVLHRDLTLANALIGFDSRGRRRVLLSDFGLSKHADPVTQLASAQGTFAFMAPEVQRLLGYSRASDVWSLGTIAYVLLTHHFPYSDGGRLDSFSLSRFDRPARPPSHFNDTVDPELDRIVLATLELDPRQRISHAMELAERLRARHAPATPPRRPEPPPRPPECDHGPEHAAAQTQATRALALARRPGGLAEAAAELDRAVRRCPCARRRHGYRVELWRRGVVM
ncbi:MULTISPECIES: serine/threonine-protein kinase [unclassified Crossiella]|uniref:serine/threonine-protein kinase n=1 Tax=unclassified Crossiella TaxID=2620835 RepID=UPI001FFE95FA|nr:MULTISPECIES: serine/threonine-protein kinase [unclassified Crossiella]MCK2242974.1 serine/threonine protein kinase [Crossiella sp. S99.2]MCK2256851.1 serine/threonine protein kinase [Crossiella sp. S99.1]